MLDHITVEDVLWICRRLDRMTDRQWRDAFRAGAFEESTAQRFIAVIEARIAEGLALQNTLPAAPMGRHSTASVGHTHSPSFILHSRPREHKAGDAGGKHQKGL